MTEIHVAPARARGELISFLAIGDVVHPGPKPSVEGLEHELATGAATVFLLASIGGTAVGTGVGKSSSVGDAYYTMVRVLPDHRRVGVGTAVLSALAEQARSAGCGSLIGRHREDDDEARRFVDHRGFSVLSRECPVSTEAPTARPFDEWAAETVEAPGAAGALPDLSLVALADNEAVGWAGLAALSGEEGAAENLLTGVRREARGRGIATALKREQARRAKRAGFLRIETVNDEGNAPMRAVNARLGFAAEPIWLLVRGLLFAPRE